MLKQENTGLIVVDIQGKLARLVHDSDTLISNCEKLIRGINALGLPIIFLEQNPEKLGETVTELSTVLPTHNPITKYTFNAGATPEFMNEISASNVDTWLICGIEAHICVYQTALHLFQSGLNIQIVCDCISSRTFANKNLAITKLTSRGLDTTSLEMCLYELVKDCRVPEFKEILRLIK
tara:strand:+ start:105 stop:644 length:540 start_codon:yes stop_codon:yes gene_type:complete